MSTKGSSKSPNKSAASEEGSKGKKKSRSSDEKSDKKSRSSSSSDSDSSVSSEDSKYSHPPFKTLVTEAVFEHGATKGTTKNMISKFISSNYNVDEDKCPANVSRTVDKMLKNKELVQIPNSRKYRLHEKWKASYMKETGRKVPKKKAAKKKDLDPNHPKRPKNAWNFFQTKVRADLKKKYPEADFGEISTKLSKRWADCEDKSEWEALANKDKKRYDKEMKVYNKKRKEEEKKKKAKESSSSSESSESETSSQRKKRKEKEKKKKKEKERKEKEKKKKQEKMDTSDDEESKGKGKDSDKEDNKEKENKEKENKEKENKEKEGDKNNKPKAEGSKERDKKK